MKYDLSKKPTRGAQRTLEAFSGTMFALLAEKPFESVTVGEICLRCSYPRATFYNYFDDKYDLLDFCWLRIAGAAKINDFVHEKLGEKSFELFDGVYDLLEKHTELINSVIRFNQPEGQMVSSLRRFMNRSVLSFFENQPPEKMSGIPHKILAAHLTNTLLLLLEWRFIQGNACSKSDAHTILLGLLGGIVD